MAAAAHDERDIHRIFSLPVWLPPHTIALGINGLLILALGILPDWLMKACANAIIATLSS